MDRATELGATLITRRVTGLQQVGGHVRALVLADDDVVPADVVVLAMGPWTGQGLEWVGKPNVVLGGRAHSVTLAVESTRTDATALFLQYRPDYTGKSVEPEVYPRPDGTVYVCGSQDDEPLPADPARVVPDPDTCAHLTDVAGRVSSLCAGAPVLHQSACFLPSVTDGRPLIGQVPGVGGLFVATGHFCWGILQGPVTGQALAELITSETTPEILKQFAPSRLIK